MPEQERKPLYSYEVKREGGEDILYINYLGAPFVPSLADSPKVMERTINALTENPNVSRVIFVQQKNYNYDFRETSFLLEITHLYTYLIKQEKILSREKLSAGHDQFFSKRYNSVFSFLNMLKKDPIAAYFELKKMIIQERIFLKKLEVSYKLDQENYIGLLEKILEMMQKTNLIQETIPYMDDYRKGDREIYNKLFKPDVIPNFTFTRLVSDLPEDSEIIDQYEISNDEYDVSLVTILKKKDESKALYHLVPPENILSEDQNMLLNLARGVLVEHQPRAEEFTDTERTRRVFFNISKDLLQDLAQNKGIKLNYSDLNKLATILMRHTIGFGVLEVLLQDKNLQDITLNAPIPMIPVFVRHQDYDECLTNILPSQEDIDSWAAKFRLVSGRPLDEANPILDTQLEIGKIRARIAIIQRPLSPDGLAYAIRRHREEPWTFPLFIQNKMINPLAAGLLGFLIDGSRTLLVAGTRSSGKCVGGDTLIQLSNGDIQPIRSLEHGKKEKISDGYVYRPNPKINILSLNNSLKINEQKVDAFWKRGSPEKLIKIITRSGKEIITTQEHPYFIFEDDLKSVSAESLKENILIATPRRINVHSEQISLLEAEEIISKVRTNALKITFPERLDKELAEFIGYLIGDGHLDEFKLEFTNSNQDLRQRFANLAKKLFSVPTRKIKDRNTFNIQITSRLLNRALNKLFEIPFGKKSSNLKIPSKILKSNNKILATFLRAYFDCDGYIPKNKRDIELVTASKIMAQQLQIVLLRFGVVSFLKIKKINDKDYYRVLIRGDFAKKYLKKIGFNHPEKKKRGKEMLKTSFIDNTNVDIIPNGNYLLKKLRNILRVIPKDLRKATGKDYWAYENNFYNVTRKWFRILVKFYEGRFNQLISLKKEIEKLNEKSDLESFKKFRKILNIKNEELSAELSIGTISNFFNEIYTPKLKTKTSISKKIREIYKNTVSSKTKNILDNALSLSNSDIFWDKIKSIERISPLEEWVYDFSINPTQNFVANGIFAHNTSLLGSLMLEIIPKYRVIVIEDTLELPIESLRNLKYDILRMKVRSALLKTTTEISADDGIRTSLRLGDSCLIIGEVRSVEAQALYEAMRVGALANVVAGTIHGASPYGVFDRVVNDLKVPATSFKATDIIVICNPIKTPDGLHSFKRVVRISEVRKHWQRDPMEEKGFVDLMKYNVEKDELEPTDDLINGDSEVIKEVAASVKGWAGNWDAVWDNILLRAKIKEELVKTAEKLKKPNILEAEFSTAANHAFHRISDEIRKEVGLPMSEKVFPEWQKWLTQEIKKRKL